MSLSHQENKILADYLLETLGADGLRPLAQAMQRTLQRMGRCYSVCLCAGSRRQHSGPDIHALEEAALEAQEFGQPVQLPASPEVCFALGCPPQSAEIRSVALGDSKQGLGAIALLTEPVFPAWGQPLLQKLQQCLASQLATLLQREEAEGVLSLEARWETLLDHFLNTLTYQYKAPLTVLLSAMQLLERRLGQTTELSAAEYERLCSHVVQNANRLLRLGDNLLDLQRLENGRFDCAFFPCDLSELMQEVLDGARPYAAGKQITLTYSGQLGHTPFVCDPALVERTLLNLLSNALKFAPAGGRIVIAAREDDSWVTISVQDNGPGLEVRQLPQLFRRFAHSPNQPAGQSGAGLGLYLAHAFVSLHGGVLSAQNDPQGGCTFTFTLSKALPPSEEEARLRGDYRHARAAVELSDLKRAE